MSPVTPDFGTRASEEGTETTFDRRNTRQVSLTVRSSFELMRLGKRVSIGGGKIRDDDKAVTQDSRRRCVDCFCELFFYFNEMRSSSVD